MPPLMAKWRTLLVLGRVSNLPTVWSNCLAGWLLGGGGSAGRFALLCAGASLLYIGGMFLNDAFDAQWDQQRRPERPIPSGAISAAEVWQWGLIWLATGLAGLAWLGQGPALCALVLTAAILVYDAVHKIFAFSPVIMAACRFLLVLTAAAAAEHGVGGYCVWAGLVLASYVVGLSYLARAESTKAALRYWPCLFLGAPVVLAVIVNQGTWFNQGYLLAVGVTVWMFYALRFTYGSGSRNIGRSVALLLAGIVLVDLLALGGGPPALYLAFGALFVAALLFQRFIPAT